MGKKSDNWGEIKQQIQQYSRVEERIMLKDIYKNMGEWEIQKALFLQQTALDLNIDLEYCEIGVNQSTGYTYLFSYDLPFVLYMPIYCNLSKDDVWVMTTDNMDGEEYERTLGDATLSDLEIWSYKMTA